MFGGNCGHKFSAAVQLKFLSPTRMTWGSATCTAGTFEMHATSVYVRRSAVCEALIFGAKRHAILLGSVFNVPLALRCTTGMLLSSRFSQSIFLFFRAASLRKYFAHCKWIAALAPTGDRGAVFGYLPRRFFRDFKKVNSTFINFLIEYAKLKHVLYSLTSLYRVYN